MKRRLPPFTIPAPIARIAARLPQLPPTLGLISALNLALDHVLPRERLAPLTGKHLVVRITDAGLTLRFTLGPHAFRPELGKRSPDLTISASARDFISLALRAEDPDSLFFSRRLLIEGETDLGLLVKNTLDAVDWDDIRLDGPLALLPLLLRRPPVQSRS